MSQEFDPSITGSRARRFFAANGARQVSAHESGGRSTGGLPGENDARAIAASLKARLGSGLAVDGVAEAVNQTEVADAIAKTLVARAERAVQALSEGTPSHSLSRNDVLAIESVINARDRPAIPLDGDDLASLVGISGIATWRSVVDTYRQSILSACAATAAVKVTDLLAGGMTWVQGSAWLIAPDLAITNRHVLFPPFMGVRLARRVPGSFSARLRKDLEVTLDFAFQNQSPAAIPYKIIEILSVTEDSDPMDAAVLKVEPLGRVARCLAFGRVQVKEEDQIYVVGHPGLMADVPDDVRMVFGDPDEKKRVSVGKVMKPPTDTALVHDASTIGGYSGACVMPFLAEGAVGLHYWGDVEYGNRALSAAAVMRHPRFARFFEDTGK